ncbi:hypothetical protein L1987_33423 [Smallanthus sonchifolius]|uniref:Uncharacterized protein n=1 Tax=Smallanthus sonchifolius TaxID=185202 RepID=A0ACB9HR17_9ASTR|nr:hypothetical protein L1987_33423 [Smallanthus sonchifolius]
MLIGDSHYFRSVFSESNTKANSNHFTFSLDFTWRHQQEHEDEVMPSVDKSTVTIDSAAVDKVSEPLGGGEGKTEGILTQKDQGEDMVVDVVGSDAVGDDRKCMRKEPETHDQDMEDVAGSGEGCDASVGIRVLNSEKDEVVVNEEGVAGEGEGCDASVGIRVLSSEKVEVIVKEELERSADVVVTVASRSNGDIAVIDSKERGLTEESVEEAADGKIAESSILTANVGSQEVDMVVNEGSVDPSLVCANNQSSAAEVVSSRTDEVDKSSKEVITDDAQEMTDGDVVVNEKIEKENEVLASSKISEPLTTMNPGSEDVDVVVVEEGLASKDEAQDDIPVDASLVGHDSATGEGEINVHAENLDQQAEIDKLSEKESFDPTIEVITETAVMVNKEAEVGLTKNDEIMEQPTEPVQEVSYGNGVMDDKTGKEDEIADSSKIPESLTTVNHGSGEVKGVTPAADTVNHPVVSCEDVDMDRGDDVGMDIDEVMGCKDEVPGTDVTNSAEKDQHLNTTANSEANVEQKLLGSSSEPVLIQHREEYIKPREPIVYGRRAHVEVPVYESLDVEQKLPEPSSPVSEDENMKIETDSEEEDDDYDDNNNNNDDESVQEDEQKDRQNPELLENGNLFSLHQPSYFKPPEHEGEFSVSDLVWGKVRSHPWWPGQIIEPSNASKKAMKYYKKDCFLVAYFGDHSFAWNSSSVLKPFWANFSQFEKQTDTEIFKIAISCALEEVSRRVELGLACSCVPKEIYKNIEFQVIENAGVRKKSDKIHGKDESARVSSFEPDKLVDYVRLLAQFPGQGDKMDLAIAKAQLSSYGHYKGHRELPEFLFCGDILEGDPVHETVEQVNKKGEKFENYLTESVNPNKEISLSDITDDARESAGGASKLVSSSGLKKRKAQASMSNGSVKRPNRPPNKASTPKPVSTPKPSFKIGELIRRAASQLTGPVVKSSCDPKVDHVDQTVQTPENSQMEASVADMLSQLHLTAQDPMKEYSFFQTIIPFFYERRAAVFSKSLKKPSTVEKPDNDMKLKPPNENDPEEFDFDFDDVNDSYWTDRIIQNHSEDQPLQDDQNGAVEEHPVVEYEPEKPAKRRRRSSKKQKQALSSNHEQEPEPEPEVEEESELVRKRRENLATEVVLKFEEGINFRSEMQLNKMFRRFGPLLESETEVDRAGGRARVVFKKCFDAEVAHNSAGKFNIFGSVSVSYELNYSPLVSYKPLPLPLFQEDQMDAS